MLKEKLYAGIIDDELAARSNLSSMIRDYCPNISAVFEATGVVEARKKILERAVDVVFLDIEMADGTGFDLIQELKQSGIKVIFTTGHEGYAVKAFRTEANDYLLKPLDPDQLMASVKRIADSITREAEAPLHLAKNNKMVLSTNNELIIVNQSDIIYCEACRNYTIFNMIDGQEIVVSRSLGYYEEKLTTKLFIRIHQSYLISWEHLRKFVKHEGGGVVMSNNKELPVSRRRRDLFLKEIEQRNGQI